MVIVKVIVTNNLLVIVKVKVIFAVTIKFEIIVIDIITRLRVIFINIRGINVPNNNCWKFFLLFYKCCVVQSEDNFTTNWE